MENNAQSGTAVSNPEKTINPSTLTVKDILSSDINKQTNSHLITIEVAIRRKPGMTGLPGLNPAERIYWLGAALDIRTKGNLKGIVGELEKTFMPSIVGHSHNAPEFKAKVEEYWSSFGVKVPHDEEFLKPHKRGVPIKIQVNVTGSLLKNRIDKVSSIEDKMNIINEALVTLNNNTNSNFASLLDESISDFLLLNFALKHSRVANNFEDIGKSPKIEFYIYEKSNAIKAADKDIKNKTKAMALYQSLTGDDRKIDAVLILFKESPGDYDDEMEKLIKIFELYNLSTQNLNNFISFVQDESWETKYLINLAVIKGKLSNPVNTTAYYYNQTMIGRTLDDAVLELNSDKENMKAIKNTLLKEVGLV